MTTFLLLAVAAGACALGWWWGGRAGQHRAIRATERAFEVREELNRSLNEVFSLHELTYALAEAQEPDSIAQTVVEYVMRFVDNAGVAVCFAEPVGTHYRVAAGGGTLAGLAGAEGLLDDGSLTALTLREGQPREAGDDAADRPLLVGAPACDGFAVGLPLNTREAAHGVLLVCGAGGTSLHADHRRLLSAVATHAAMALANARYLLLVRAARDQWETTFDGMADAVALLDRDGRVRRANRALALFLGRPLSDVIGLQLDRALFGSPTLEPALLAARAGVQGSPVTRRSDLLGRDLRFSVSPLPGGSEDGWTVAVVEDVTDQRALEAQLILSERMAAMGQLVSGVAHELNNPLTSIAGLSELLATQAVDQEQATQHLHVIREQADRASRIVRNLLTFARHGPEERGPVQLNEVVERSAALIGYEVGLQGIGLVLALEKKLPPIGGDRYQIQQVVLNLLTNAVHAVGDQPAGRPRSIRLETAVEGGEVVLRVVDSGPGVPAEILPTIFEPFTTTKASGHGTGLGLSITYRLVQGHGGTIAVTSEADGTTFTVRLPKWSEQSEPATTTTPIEPAVAGGRRILLVDADPGVRRLIRTLFVHEGHEVETAEQAADGVARLERGPFDLVIGDARAAVSPGETLGDALHRRFPAYRTRSILLTADVRGETDTWLRSLGYPYFRKPFSVRDLRATAARILASGSERRERAAGDPPLAGNRAEDTNEHWKRPLSDPGER